MLYHLADWFFVLFHTAWVIFNLSGWIWRKTRWLNLILLLTTGLSWSVLGIWYGFGYCPLTDWHWAVLERLGRRNLPDSYMKYLLDRLTGLDWNAALVEALTLLFFVVALVLSAYFNMRDYRRYGRR